VENITGASLIGPLTDDWFKYVMSAVPSERYASFMTKSRPSDWIILSRQPNQKSQSCQRPNWTADLHQMNALQSEKSELESSFWLS